MIEFKYVKDHQYDVYIDGKKIDVIDMNKERGYTQAHLALFNYIKKIINSEIKIIGGDRKDHYGSKEIKTMVLYLLDNYVKRNL